MKKALKVLGGSLAGAVVGAVATPGYMVSDIFAPITYPVLGAVGGASVAEGMNGNAVVGAVIGGAVGFASIPLAPLNFIQRPLTPLFFGIFGGVLASKKV